MLSNLLKDKKIILGSASPRRKELLSDIGLEFSIQTTDKEEGYPTNLKEHKIAEFLAKQKAKFLSENFFALDINGDSPTPSMPIISTSKSFIAANTYAKPIGNDGETIVVYLFINVADLIPATFNFLIMCWYILQ